MKTKQQILQEFEDNFITYESIGKDREDISPEVNMGGKLRKFLSDAIDQTEERVFGEILDMRDDCHVIYNGGHNEKETNKAFHHGMDTVFNVVDNLKKGGV